MNPFRLFVFLFFCLLGTTATEAQTLSWYKCFTGNIGKYPVTLHLHKAGNRYSGYYYYASREEPVSISGQDTSNPGKIELMAYSSLPEDESTEVFLFQINGNAATGTWKKDEKSSPLMFSAVEKAAPGGLAFDYVYTEGRAALFAGWPESPAATYEAASVWPKNSGSGAKLRPLIAKYWNSTDPREEIGKFLLKEKKSFFDTYKEDNAALTKEEAKENTYAYNYDASRRLEIVYQQGNLLSLADNTYTYTGGAHGNYGIVYSSYDLIRNRELKPEDIFTSAGIKALPALLEESLRKKYKIAAGEKLSEALLFEDSIAPGENFMVTSKGILFGYVPYEIGPYAAGQIEVFIPFSICQDKLQPGFKALLKP